MRFCTVRVGLGLAAENDGVITEPFPHHGGELLLCALARAGEIRAGLARGWYSLRQLAIHECASSPCVSGWEVRRSVNVDVAGGPTDRRTEREATPRPLLSTGDNLGLPALSRNATT